jgi:hypothetical protein
MQFYRWKLSGEGMPANVKNAQPICGQLTSSASHLGPDI